VVYDPPDIVHMWLTTAQAAGSPSWWSTIGARGISCRTSTAPVRVDTSMSPRAAGARASCSGGRASV